MKNYLFQLTFILAVGLSYGQNLYHDTTSPNSMADGVYYQAGPGSNNGSYNWAYPYGTKLSIKGGSINRTFEIMTTSYPFGGLKLRQWNSSINSWTSWRDILLSDENGNIGIGTSTPSARLTLNNSSDHTKVLQFGANGPTHWFMGVGNNAGDFFHIGDNSNKRLVIKKISGNIGIGTENPLAGLEIFKGSTNNLALLLKSSGAGWGSGLQLENTSGNKYGIYSGSDGKWHFSHESQGDRFVVDASGNMGIGTTETQGFKLGVNGDIAALEVKIATYANWPDYVFNDTYSLPALEDVEQHIKEKGHLKNIPSAEEVKEDGFFLGDMNSKLLQKIEELTLYTIDQEKKLETLKSNNDEQQKKIETLEKENKELNSLSKRLAAIEALLSNQKQ